MAKSLTINTPPGQSNLDWEKVAIETATVVEQMNDGSLDDSAGIAKLNKILKTFSQIEWMGTVSDLLTGGHSYAVKVRQHFRDEQDDELSKSPIQPGEEEEFFRFLETFGM